jgi:hypothetical protein
MFGSAMYLADYLRRFHILTWMGLGQPEVSEWSKGRYYLTGNPFVILGFVFSNRYQKLEDTRLSALIWLIRILGPLALLLFPLTILVAWLEGS